ncbi:hypothetical protein [Bradyrhizobium liaoningense]|uniref:hypothetical protein n=1 Tax=Bradyrhizobium liaoningense TaxID=43992 RepID=UPI001BACFACD|nr:hypothetical protein [Bradyrhizobium liaoningense]MBR1033705.1 hypothetical protein [Bradyrhizobium liaoningense]
MNRLLWTTSALLGSIAIVGVYNNMTVKKDGSPKLAQAGTSSSKPTISTPQVRVPVQPKTQTEELINPTVGTTKPWSPGDRTTIMPDLRRSGEPSKDKQR